MRHSTARGMVAGIIGGLAGSVALRVWMTAASKLHTGQTRPDQNGPAHQVGTRAVRALTGQEPSAEGRFVIGEVTHYMFGAVNGGVYGALAEWQPWVTAGAGALFGTGVFVAADESSMPALGLVPWPWQETAAAQAEHWAAHLVFGMVAEWARRETRRRL